ncbi:MAG: helix-turn-helix domain-containing protein [Armatimonadota bacterium]
MSNYEHFRLWLRQELEHRRWNLAELSRRSKVTIGHLSRIMSGERVPGIETLVKIAVALHLPAEEVLRHAGLATTPRGAVEGQEELQRYFAEMTPADRKRLLTIARAFVVEQTAE